MNCGLLRLRSRGQSPRQGWIHAPCCGPGVPQGGGANQGELVKPYYERNGITIYHADARDVLPCITDVDLVLTDPPYGIENQTNAGRRKANYSFESNWEDTREFVRDVFIPILANCLSITSRMIVTPGVPNLDLYFQLLPKPKDVGYSKL